MPGQNRAAAYPRHKGWWHDGINNRLVAVFNGTEVFDYDANDVALTSAAAFAAQSVQTAGDMRVTAGNLRLGAVETFGTTEPTSAVVMKTGTAPAGAITTSGGLFSAATVVQKIIAAGTVSNVET
jgi:hypothetical protein